MKLSIARTFFAVAVFMLCSLLPGQGSAEAAEIIRINGSGSALYVMKPLVRAYIKAHPEVRIEMDKPIGSSGAVKALLVGALDIAVSSKILKPEERAKGAVSREYGKTPLTIVTGKKVTKTDITTRELEEIYYGKRRTWSDGEPIRLILRPDADIDAKILEGLSPGMGVAIKAAQTQHGMIVAITDPESDEAIAKTAGSLGASTLPAILVEKTPLNLLSLNGIKPTLKTLADGTYPLAKNIRFITTKNTPSAAFKLIDFIFSPQGRAIAEKSGVLVAAGVKAGQ